MADLSFDATQLTSTVPSEAVGRGVVGAGASIGAGQPLFRASVSPYGLFPSDANHGTPANRAVIGLALNGAADGQPIAWTGGGDMTFADAPLTAGTVYILSANVGKICPIADLASGSNLVIIGVAISTSVLRLSINNTGWEKP